MGKRLRTLAFAVVLVGVGLFLGSALSQGGRRVEAPVLPLPPLPKLPGRVRVEVLNAGGRPGLARQATEALREAGFDVVYYGNAEPFTPDSSVVVDRVGRLEPARAAADVLGIRQVRSLPDSNLYVDVTVRLGPEWSLPSPSAGEDERPRPWWDLRRLFGGPDASRTPQPQPR